jgi:8-oxo-dGTP diphosphatase
MPIKPLALSVKLAIRDDVGRLLFLKRPDDCDWNPGRWDLPGGKIEALESFDDALRREVREETGLDVTVQTLLAAVEDEADRFRLVHLIFLGGKAEGEVRLSDEHSFFSWMHPGDIDSRELCSYLNEALGSLEVVA